MISPQASRQMLYSTRLPEDADDSRWCSSPSSSTVPVSEPKMQIFPINEPRLKRKRRNSCITIFSWPTKVPNQIVRKNSLDLEREVPLRMPSQHAHRHSDLVREVEGVGHSLQAMASVVRRADHKDSAEALKTQLRRSLPPRLPQRQASHNHVSY